MTSAPYSRPRPVSDVESAAAILRAEGHRVTAGRRLIVEVLLAAEGPISAELVAVRCGGGSAAADAASVYRNLELFEQLGLVRHVHIGHGPGLYSLASGEERCFVVCERCGALGRLSPREAERIGELIADASGFEAHFSHFPVLGLCPRCVALRDGAEPAAGPRAGEHSHEHSHRDRVHSHPHSHDGGHGGDPHRHPHD